jgi:hypothetical protein
MLSFAALASFVAALFSMVNPVGNFGMSASLTVARPVILPEGRRESL